MSFEIPGRKITRVAAADLSGKQYRMVKLDNTAKVAAFAADTDRPYGILQDKPTAGMEAEIMKNGVSKLYAGAGGIVMGDPVIPDADGKGTVGAFGADVTKFVIGVALETVAAGGLFAVDFDCGAAPRGA